MKKNILKLTFLLSIFILVIGCSTEGENPVEDQITTNLFGFDDQTEIETCADSSLYIPENCISYMYIEYRQGTTNKQKSGIRAPYCNFMLAVDQCDINPNAEIWTILEPCIEQPSVIPPVDPDLESIVYPSVGLCL
ncbi:hypothetical protein [Dokdonia sp.]|uniref:hypothetical protein n=1 Tax=Dokdonia sp. TaxID=2024995 RepID=UPI0032653239